MRKQSVLPDTASTPLGDILLAHGTLNEEQLQNAREAAIRKVQSLEHVLREEHLVTDALLQQIVEEQVAPMKRNEKIGKGIGGLLAHVCHEKMKWSVLWSARRAENALLRTERAKRRSEEEERQQARQNQREEEKRHRQEERQQSLEIRRKQREEKKQERTERRAKRTAERQARIEIARRQKEEAHARRAEAARFAREKKERKVEARKRAAEEERAQRKQKKEARKEQKRLQRDAKAQRAADIALQRMLEKAAHREEHARRRRAFIQNVMNVLTRKEAVRKEAEKEQSRLIDEARREATRQVLIEEEKRKLRSSRTEVPAETMHEERETVGEATISTVQVNSPERVFVSSPMRIVEHATPTVPAPAVTEQELTQFAKERQALLAEIATLKQQQRTVVEVSAQAPATSTGSGPSAVSDAERGAFAKEKQELLETIASLKAAQPSTLPAPTQKKTKGTPVAEQNAMSDDEKTKLLARVKAEFEAELRAKETAFQAEKESLIRQISTSSSSVGTTDPAAIERIRTEAEAEARAQFEQERTQWEIEKARIKQQAIAEAEGEFIAKMKGGSGLLGNRHKDVLTKEIVKWKMEAERLEKERLELERAKALHAEQERVREQERKMEEGKLQLERDRIEHEKRAMDVEDAHKEVLESGKFDIARERKDLDEMKKRREKERKAEQKAKKKRGKDEEKHYEKDVGTSASKLDVGAILVAQNYLEQAELEEAKKRATERNVSVENILREDGLVTKDIIQNAIAEYYKMPFVDVGAEPPDTSVVEMLPEAIAAELHATAIKNREDGTLVVATYAPERSEEITKRIMEEIKGVKNIEMVYTSRDAIDAALAFYRKPLNTRFRSIIEEHKKIAPEIIEEIFADAVQLGASDIHFEPQEKGVIVRFRVDGVMHEAGRLPKEYYEGIVNRIKIAGNMRIDEHFAAQDGAIRWRHGDRAMDVRVSIVPIVDGEKIVMRLLSEYVRTLTLRDLGFSPNHLNALVQASRKPFGMILTTGPTGSGKSTTLYGLMKLRNSPDVNISTIEDPVEYKIPGINHIQVNVKANLTFERGLRALVRQDPDIILVGEIRDDITAQISVNAALTGHLLFSTLHANDAATAVPRLLEMGIEPYLLASTLEIIIAQRLMRRICMNCRYSTIIPQSEAQKLFQYADRYFTDGNDVTIYKGKGCPTCGGTGFKGRVGIYELLTVTSEIEEMITNRRTSGEMNVLAREQGMLTLFEDGLEKVLAGLSTIEELLRIAAPPDPIPTPLP